MIKVRVRVFTVEVPRRWILIAGVAVALYAGGPRVWSGFRQWREERAARQAQLALDERTWRETIRRGDPGDDINHVEASLAYWDAMENVAYLLIKQERWAEAERFCRETGKHDYADVFKKWLSRYMLATVLDQLGKSAEASKVSEEARRLLPSVDPKSGI